MPSFKKTSKENQPKGAESKKNPKSTRCAKKNSKLSKEGNKEPSKQVTKPSIEKANADEDSEARKQRKFLEYLKRKTEENEMARVYMQLRYKVEQKIWETHVIEPLLSTGLQEMMNQFNSIENKPLPEMEMMYFTVNQRRENGKNRYSQIGCWDESRVKCGGYIHANYIMKEAFIKDSTSEARKFAPKVICTQGPLEKTREDFWHMVYEENIEEIVMLCNFKEEGVVVCSRYFPENVDDVRNFGDMRIECFKFEEDTAESMFRREFKVTHKERKNENPMIVRHLHYTNAFVGPDAPRPSFLQHPCSRVVHCSDGVGRSGIAAYILLVFNHAVMWNKDKQKLNKENKIEPPINVYQKTPFQLFLQLRESRYLAIKTVEQFALALRMILEQKISREVPNSEIEQGKKKFMEDYDKLIRKAKK